VNQEWYQIRNPESVATPALLVYPRRVRTNIDRMIRVAGLEHLRPHVKTHKMPAIVEISIQLGIKKFKCATVAEAEMLAACGAEDVLLAYQPVGPNQSRLKSLVEKFPRTTFSTIVDCALVMEQLSELFRYDPLSVWIDLDCGMHRSGVELADFSKLLKRAKILTGIKIAGVHAYDGHIHEPDVEKRRVLYEEVFSLIQKARQELSDGGFASQIVAGGTPTFPFHAASKTVDCSPGTPVLWDHGYQNKYPDLGYEIAAVLATRVVGKPKPNWLCLDLGHKSVAAENPQPRVFLPEIPDATAVMHSEEHLVVETARADDWKVGDMTYAFPRHICPSCALYSEAVTVEGGLASGVWKVAARERKITV